MKKALLLIAVAALLASCTEKKTCMSCIAEAHSGVTVDYFIECSEDVSFLQGYAEGRRLYYKDNGDTVKVHCIYE
ncbi:hypothetical protein [Edaphocola aurantiacus]|uniref:hypothetical protein n=1 Tax=Edaphocola aurantiacus TaxID=2601682 RepID=UPI001C939712|nr:hypothetical protein [Edaphocola aurantiacus]